MNEKWGSTRCQGTGQDWAYSCFCPQCASSSAKSKQEGSSCLFNFLCFPPPAMYSMVRYNYNIKGECGDDMLWGWFCMPCSIRQALAEGNTRGALQGTKQGALDAEWPTGLTSCDCLSFCTAAIVPCVVSNNIRKILHPASDSCFNMFCFVPCSMYGQVRHTYGVKSEWPYPVCEDVAVGTVCYPCALSRAYRLALAQQEMYKGTQNIESVRAPGMGV